MRDIIDVKRGIENVVLYFGTLAVCCVVALGVACQPLPTQPDVTIVNTNTNTTNTGGSGANPQASPSPGTCGPVVEVTNGLLGAGGVKNASLRLSDPARNSVTLDTTPNKNADEHCNAFRQVRWTITQSTLVCELNNPESYTPIVTARGVGTCVIRASIAGVSATEPITVTVTQ